MPRGTNRLGIGRLPVAPAYAGKVTGPNSITVASRMVRSGNLDGLYVERGGLWSRSSRSTLNLNARPVSAGWIRRGRLKFIAIAELEELVRAERPH